MLILTVYFAALFAWLLLRKTPMFSFPFVTTAIWLTVIAISSLGMITYRTEFAYSTAIFVIACHSAMLLGFFMIRADKERPRAMTGAYAPSQILFMLSVLFIILQAASSLSQGHIPILGSAANIQQARFEHVAGEGNALQSIARLFAYPTIAFVILMPIYFKHRQRAFFIGAILGMLMLMDMAFAEGGRAVIVFAGIGIIATYFLCYEVTFGRRFFTAVIGAIVVIQLGSTFYLSRNRDFGKNPDYYIARNCIGGTAANWVREGKLATQALALSSCYITAPVRMLDDFLTGDIINHHTLGAYNFSIIYPVKFLDTRDRIANHYRAQDMGENPWSTSMRDFWIDWGYFSVLFCVPFGALFGMMTRRSRLRSELQVARYSLAVVAAVMIPFISPLVIRYIVYPIIVTWLVAAIIRVLPTKRVKVSAR